MNGHEACDRRIAALEAELDARAQVASDVTGYYVAKIARLTAERDEARREAERQRDLRSRIIWSPEPNAKATADPLPWEVES